MDICEEEDKNEDEEDFVYDVYLAVEDREGDAQDVPIVEVSGGGRCAVRARGGGERLDCLGIRKGILSRGLRTGLRATSIMARVHTPYSRIQNPESKPHCANIVLVPLRYQ